MTPGNRYVFIYGANSSRIFILKDKGARALTELRDLLLSGGLFYYWKLVKLEGDDCDE
ncbi:hypothetical protein SAMN04487909_11264 [Aneurinibacillus migulanus]|uniref:Uncharacterized protein n=1 Tax=Aneurinibacillus migulanus TaxID=47500 RepID=A0A1G8R5V3_ANEMI|nr:hypothetical protein SAMN04487909_11264 [Aneurinibacillus migulanus]